MPALRGPAYDSSVLRVRGTRGFGVLRRLRAGPSAGGRRGRRAAAAEDAGHRVHDVPREEPHDALAIALDAEESFALTGAQQVDEAREPELALVERRLDVAEE